MYKCKYKSKQASINLYKDFDFLSEITSKSLLINKELTNLNKYLDLEVDLKEYIKIDTNKYENSSQDKLNKLFIDACSKGHLDIVKYLLTSPNLKKHADINFRFFSGFKNACKYGRLHIVKYLSTSPDSTKDYIDQGFKLACKYGRLDIIKYLLSSPDLKQHANIHFDNDYAFRLAISNRNLELIKYLLTSPDLKEHANIHANDDYAFRLACENGDLDIVKYLLTSPDLKIKADINAKDDEGFRLACYFGKLYIIKFLIFDMNLKLTKLIEKYLYDNNCSGILQLFKTRDERNKLLTNFDLNDFKEVKRNKKI